MAQQFTPIKALSTTEDVSVNTWNEGATDSLTTGNNDSTIDLAKGDIGQVVHKIYISIPGAVGTPTVVFYDGAAATTPISGTLYIGAEPGEGFILNKALQTGTLGIRIAGLSSGTPTALINVRYSY